MSMKKVLMVLLCIVFLLSLAGLTLAGGKAFDGTGDTPKAKTMLKAKTDAQALKAEGKWAEAAALHPQSLCRAMYWWNAACQEIGTRNENGDWVYNLSKRDKNGVALQYLANAQKELDAPDDYGCTGVDVRVLQMLITKVKNMIEANP
jgi:hypothetical protein